MVREKQNPDDVKQTVVIISGHAGAGKDTAGQILIDRGFALEKFAQPLYDMLSVMYNIPVNVLQRMKLDDVQLPHTNRTVREGLQLLGTEWGRHMLHENIWTNLCIDRIQSRPKRNFVVTDCRFLNEAKVMETELNASVITVAIRRPNCVGSWMQHGSESYIETLASFSHFHLHNTGTLEEFRETVRAWADHLGL